MNIRALVVVQVLFSAACIPQLRAQPSVSSNFDTGLDGWSAVGFNVVPFPPSATRVPNPADMVHSATGGNPNGYARLTDAVSDPGSFASAPAKFLGNLSAYKDVGMLSFDHRLFATGTPNSGIQPYAAFMVSGDPNNFNFLYWQTPGPTAATNWIHFDVPINTANWIRSPFASLSFDQILSNVTELLLPFELVDNDGNQNQEHGGLDNVVLAAAAALPGDFNDDGDVDAADYVSWRDSANPTQANYNLWRSNFGRTSAAAAGADFGATGSASAVAPEPASLLLLLLAIAILSSSRRFA